MCKQLCAQLFLDKRPKLVDGFILLSHLGIGCFLVLVFSQELLKRACIETPRLLINKGCLHQHGIGSLVQDVLHLLVGNGEPQLFGLLLNELVLHIASPNHVLHLIKLLVVQVILSLLHFDSLGVLVNHLLEFLNADLLAIHLANLLSLVVACGLARTECLFGNKCQQAKTNDSDENHATASNFS